MQNPIQYAACPNCGQSNAKKVSFSFWGGALGPAMMTHVKCQNCATEYNGKTGQSNQRNIILYFVISFALGLCICGGLSVFSYVLNNS